VLRYRQLADVASRGRNADTAAPRRRGIYATAGRGMLELGSPMPDVVMGWATALAGCGVPEVCLCL
jgi:hypothetical protein